MACYDFSHICMFNVMGTYCHFVFTSCNALNIDFLTGSSLPENFQKRPLLFAGQKLNLNKGT